MPITPITRREALLSAGALAATSVFPVPAESQAVASNPGTQMSEMSSEIVCLTDFEPVAQQKMSHVAWEYINAGAADELTVRWNKEAYQKIRLKPRVLVDVSKLDPHITLFGQEHVFPILLSPTSGHKLVHPDGELATARGAGAAGATMVVSSFSSTSLEDIAAVTKSPLWFQLYAQTDRGFTEELVRRAEASGYRALCLTVDAPVSGVRNREARAKVQLPSLPNLSGLKATVSGGSYRTDGRQIYSAILDLSLIHI